MLSFSGSTPLCLVGPGPFLCLESIFPDECFTWPPLVLPYKCQDSSPNWHNVGACYMIPNSLSRNSAAILLYILGATEGGVK
jgi:hypothetical protein